jgi:hypothetical protein
VLLLLYDGMVMVFAQGVESSTHHQPAILHGATATCWTAADTQLTCTSAGNRPSIVLNALTQHL